jgi:hypothetical protein
MEQTEYIDERGRKYKVWSNGDGLRVVIGPPEGMVDSLGFPEEFATRLHNILYARQLFSLADISKTQNALVGAIQETLGLDAQRLHEAYFKYGHEEVTHG